MLYSIQGTFDFKTKNIGLKKKLNEYKYEGKDYGEDFKRKINNDPGRKLFLR